MILQDSEVAMQNHVGGLETAVDDALNHGLPLERAKMLRDIALRTHLDVLCLALLGGPPAHMESITVRLQPGVGVVRRSTKT